MRHVKVIATLGPKKDLDSYVHKLIKAGADVFRLNCSHLSPEELYRSVNCIRKIATTQKRSIGILADLQGVKLRIGTLEKGAITLKEGDTFCLDTSSVSGNTERAPFLYPDLYTHIKPNMRIMLSDGTIALDVIETKKNSVTCIVCTGGILRERQGVNIPSLCVPRNGLTSKDTKDLEHALAAGVDFIGVSFVETADDINAVKSITGEQAQVLAKIERPQAVDNLTSILEVSDGLMIARGDLGVELPLEELPILQKTLIRDAHRLGKPVIVATQMLESMTHNPRPTRAEASDVANAVLDGCDALLLSGETAVGAYPHQTVEIACKLILACEANPLYKELCTSFANAVPISRTRAIASAARHIENSLSCAAIVSYTATGETALWLSQGRPSAPIIAIVQDKKQAQKLSLLWGVTSFVLGTEEMSHTHLSSIKSFLKTEGFAQIGDNIIITSGYPLGTPGSTDTLQIDTVQ